MITESKTEGQCDHPYLCNWRFQATAQGHLVSGVQYKTKYIVVFKNDQEFEDGASGSSSHT